MKKPTLLLLDDDQWLLESMSTWLGEHDFHVTSVRSSKEAKRTLSEVEFDACLADICLEDEDGLSLLRWAKDRAYETPFVMMTGYGGPDMAAEAVQIGAFDLLTKPIIDQDLLTTLRRAIDQKKIASENERLRDELERRSGMEEVISHDPRMLRIFDIIESIADTKATVLITGENGTGKSMIARAIHRRSERAHKPFVEVACGALPDNLLESELFGHKAGAFTGANTDKVGKFEHADSGTIFLDEIGTATPAMQIKLLRVLQEFQFEPIGGNETCSVDTRCVLATNEDLENAVAQGSFRQDLYYRINVIHLELPALRERSSDIPILAEQFLQKALKDVKKEVDSFSPEALDAMLNYSWPGNIRELENVVQRAVLLTKSPTIDIDLLPAPLLGGANRVPSLTRFAKNQTLREALEGPERQIIMEVLKANGYSRNLTADQLGINRTTLYKKMKRLGIETVDLAD
ncbi:MAG: sigma-54 dependent transcriptional regulator [Planctomycetota bacterium]|nr:sigma-54 dependent transcriptional regulator [Planctomycetota bacterium]